MTAIERFTTFYQELSPDNISQLPDIYSDATLMLDMYTDTYGNDTPMLDIYTDTYSNAHTAGYLPVDNDYCGLERI